MVSWKMRPVLRELAGCSSVRKRLRETQQQGSVRRSNQMHVLSALKDLRRNRGWPEEAGPWLGRGAHMDRLRGRERFS